MRIVLKEPGEAPRAVDIANDLHAMQDAVGGFIETVRLSTEHIIVCNEEGRLLELEPNTFGICGTFFVCGDAGEEFRELDPDEAETIISLLSERGER